MIGVAFLGGRVGNVLPLDKVSVRGLGYGVRSMVDVPKGAKIGAVSGKRVSLTDKRYIGSPYLFQLDANVGLEVSKSKSLLIFVNHSCEPNTAFFIEGETVEVWSTRKINRLELLTADYGSDPNREGRMVCLCGSRRCRGFI